MTKTNNTRVVLDTNVLVSAVLFLQSRPWQVFDYITRQGVVLLSTATLSELEDVLLRSRFDRYLQLERRQQFLDSLIRSANPVEISQSITACRDPKDDKFLELAVNGRATHIVSGDNDLLVLHPFRGIPILTPLSFLLEYSV